MTSTIKLQLSINLLHFRERYAIYKSTGQWTKINELNINVFQKINNTRK